jgi:phosphoserine phosphatase RsbU/P
MNFEHQVGELLLLQRVAQRITSILDLDVLLEEIVSDVAQTFGYSRAAVLLVDGPDLVIAAVRGWTTNFHLKGERFRIGEYGMVGHVGTTGETYYAPDVTVDPYYQVSETLTRSELDIPLKARGRMFGVFSVQHNEVNSFSPGRIQVLEALAGHLSVAIDNAQMFTRERAEKQRMEKELSEAHAIQSSLLPANAPLVDGFELSGVCLPCRGVGGDWFDYIPLSNGRVGLVVADVAGKGSAAALLMSSTRSILRMIGHQGESPSTVLTELNEILLNDFPAARFVTMIYALLDPRRSTLTFANAGHPPPIWSNGQTANFVDGGGGLPLGILRRPFDEHALDLNEGSRFLMYSDGVLEAESLNNEEYGYERILEHVATSDATPSTLLREVREFTGGVPLGDDATVLMVESRKQ